MLRLTPTDKLHAVRYNQAGREYYQEYFNPGTPFGEAKVKPGIWERWFPDICVDNHGFPSHEWEQPFSGYSPFRFREWWIPRSLFFFYLPYLEKKKNSLQKINSEFLYHWVVTALSKEKGIMKWNQTFSRRYWKYRGRWQRNVSEHERKIQCFPLRRRFQRTNYSYRYPHVTTADFITEVADEIAQGKFLKTCISAHQKTNLAILRMLNYFRFRGRKVCLFKRKDSHFFWHRERPLALKKF